MLLASEAGLVVGGGRGGVATTGVEARVGVDSAPDSTGVLEVFGVAAGGG
jgi:hypothetical protein